MMIVKQVILLDMIDDYRLMAIPNFITNCRFNRQLATRNEAELTIIADTTSNPLVFGNPGYGRKSHPGSVTDNVQKGRYNGNSIYPVNIPG